MNGAFCPIVWDNPMKRLIFLAVFLYGCGFFLLVFLQNPLIYPFDPTRVSPAAAGEPRLTERFLTASDGTNLVVWVGGKPKSGRWVVYFHGNAGNLAVRAQRFDRLLDRGYGVVAMAYRGSSGSGGAPTEAAIQADSRMLHQSLRQLIGRNPRRVIYYGESLGTAVATDLAATYPPDGLILEAPFRSLDVLVAEQFWMFPVSLGLRNHWPTENNIQRVTSPLFVMHGEADRTIPVEHGQRVFDLASSPQKTLRRVPGIGHTGHWDVAGQRAIFRFIDGL